MRRTLVRSSFLLTVTVACGGDDTSGSGADDETVGDSEEPGDTGTAGMPDTCGDGVVDPGEACDDGNLIDTDACTNACTLGDTYLHTCGMGGPIYAWTEMQVPYPPGTTTANGTPVDTATYEVLAPPPTTGPLPLVVLLHGDEGDPGTIKSHFQGLWDAQQSFVVVALQEPHQAVDGGDSENGWDNYQPETEQFLRTVLDDVGAIYDIDLERVYATGVSAGGWIGGRIFYRFQDVFAAVQLSCGSAGSPDYVAPSSPACLLPTRFEIAADDFLYDSALSNSQALMELGNEVEFSVSACSGHCCGGAYEYGQLALEFFTARQLCGGGLAQRGCSTFAGGGA